MRTPAVTSRTASAAAMATSSGSCSDQSGRGDCVGYSHSALTGQTAAAGMIMSSPSGGAVRPKR